MYDMYHWHRIDASADDSARRAASTSARTGEAPRTGARQGRAADPGSGPAVQAVQVALDRRDNGGDLGTTRDE